MWIEYIEEIGLAFFILLIAMHFAPLCWEKVKSMKEKKVKSKD